MEVGKPKGAIAGKGPEFFSLPAKPQAMLFDLLRLQAYTTMLRKPKLPGEKFLNSQRIAATRVLHAEQASLDRRYHRLLARFAVQRVVPSAYPG